MAMAPASRSQVLLDQAAMIQRLNLRTVPEAADQADVTARYEALLALRARRMPRQDRTGWLLTAPDGFTATARSWHARGIAVAGWQCQSSMRAPMMTVRSRGRRKYSAASAVSRAVARNRRLRQRAMPGWVPGRRSMVDRK